MSVARHVLWKDLRGHAWWIVTWMAICGAIAGKVPISAALTAQTTGSFRPVLGMALAALVLTAPLVRFVLFVLLISMVVHEDPLLDSRAFWLTRPISGRMLLGGKAAFIGLLVVLPAVVADLVALGGDGARLRQVALAAPEIAIEWTLWAACLLVLASLSRSSRGVAVAFGKAAVLALAVFTLLFLPLASHGPLGEWYRSWFSLDASDTMLAARGAVAIVFGLVAAPIVAAIQYAHRRQALTWAAMAASLACMTLVVMAWRWDFVGSVEADTPANASTPAAPTARVESITVWPWDPRAPQPEPNATYFEGAVRFAFDGVPPGVVAEVERVTGTITRGDTPAISVAPAYAPVRSWVPEGVEGLLEGARIVNPPHGPAGTRVTLSTSADALAGMTGRASLRADIVLRRYRVAAALPLEVGARYVRRGTEAVVTSVAFAGDHCTVSLDETQVRLLLAPDPPLLHASGVLYVLRNPRRREALWPGNVMAEGSSWPFAGRLQRAGGTLTFEAGATHLDDAWMAGAELVRVEGATIGVFPQRIDTDGVTLVTPSDLPPT